MNNLQVTLELSALQKLIEAAAVKNPAPVKGAGKKIADLEKMASDLKKENSDLKKENSDLKKENSDLKKQLNLADEDIKKAIEEGRRVDEQGLYWHLRCKDMENRLAETAEIISTATNLDQVIESMAKINGQTQADATSASSTEPSEPEAVDRDVEIAAEEEADAELARKLATVEEEKLNRIANQEEADAELARKLAQEPVEEQKTANAAAPPQLNGLDFPEPRKKAPEDQLPKIDPTPRQPLFKKVPAKVKKPKAEPEIVPPAPAAATDRKPKAFETLVPISKKHVDNVCPKCITARGCVKEDCEKSHHMSEAMWRFAQNQCTNMNCNGVNCIYAGHGNKARDAIMREIEEDMPTGFCRVRVCKHLDSNGKYITN